MEQQENEIWKDVPGFEGYYQASSLGNIRSTLKGRTRILSNNHKLNDYVRFKAAVNGVITRCYAHRFVALAFVPNSEGKAQVNHINGIKHDNRACNLEWVSHYENFAHAAKIGIGPCEKPVIYKNLITGEEGEFKSFSEAGKVLGIDPKRIGRVCNGTHRWHKNFSFRNKQ